MKTLSNPFPNSSHPLFFELSKQALSLQSNFNADCSVREKNLQEKLNKILSNLDSKISKIKAYHKSLLVYEKDLKNIYFSTIDDVENKIKDLDSLINTETHNLLTNLTQNFAISISNAYCSLLQELKESFATAQSLKTFDFGSIRPHFSTIFETYEIDVPKEFIDSAVSLEKEVGLTFNQSLNELLKNQKPSLDSEGKAIRTPDFEPEEDEIEKKMKSLDKKFDAGTQSAKTSLNQGDISKSKSQSVDLSSSKTGGFFSKMKSIFSKKKPEDEGLTATEMKLGDEAKFRYDPVKKKYIFEGEEEEPEEVIPPPMMLGAVSKSAPKEQDKKEEGSRDSLIKPPARTFPHRKKEEPKKVIEKFTSFNPHESHAIQENLNPKIQEKPKLNVERKLLKKKHYSEDISLHFEKIIKHMKDKINDFLENRLQKNEDFYFELSNMDKTSFFDPLKVFENDIRPLFSSKIDEISEFQSFLFRTPEESKENILKIEKKTEENDQKTAELAAKLSLKSRENLLLEKSLIELQNHCFGFLNDNLWLLMNPSKITGSQEVASNKTVDDFAEYRALNLRMHELSRTSKESQDEIFSFMEKRIEENRGFLNRVIDQLLLRISQIYSEKKAVYEGFKELLQLQRATEGKIHDLLSENANLNEALSNKDSDLLIKSNEIRSLQEEIDSYRHLLEEKSRHFMEEEEFLRGKLQESAIKCEELKGALDSADHKVEDLSKEILENQKNIESSLRSEDVSRLLSILNVENTEIHSISNIVLKLKFLFSRLLQKVEDLMTDKENRIESLSVEKNKLQHFLEREREFYQREIADKNDRISLLETKFENLERQFKEENAKNEQHKSLVEKLEKDKENSMKNLEMSEGKNLELLKENSILENKLLEINNANLRLSAEINKVRTLAAKFDSDSAEKMAEFREGFSQLENENRALKQESFSLGLELKTLEKKLSETDRELKDMKNRNQENHNKFSEMLRSRDLKVLDLESTVNELQDQNESLKKSNQMLQDGHDRVSSELSKIHEENGALRNKEKELSRKLNGEMNEMRNDIENLSAENRRLNEALDQSRTTIQIKIDELKEESKANEINQRKISELSQNLQQINLELNHSKSELEKAHKENLSQRNLIFEEKNVLQADFENQLSLLKNNEMNMVSKLAEAQRTENELRNLIAQMEAKYSSEKAENSEEIFQLKNILDEKKQESIKLQENLDSLKEDNDNLRVRLLKYQGTEDFLKEKLAKLSESDSEIRRLYQMVDDLQSKIHSFEENGRSYEDRFASLNKTLKELRRENEELKEENEKAANENSRASKLELENLQKVLEKKTKMINQLKEGERELEKKIEELKKFEMKSKETEEFNNTLMREKKKLLEENDHLYGELNKKEFYQETVSLKQKLKNVEEEKNLLKISQAETINNMNSEISKYREIVENMKKNESVVNHPDSSNLQKNFTEKVENYSQKIVEPKNEEETIGETTKPTETAKQGGGFMFGLASFFLTDKELKSVKK